MAKIEDISSYGPHCPNGPTLKIHVETLTQDPSLYYFVVGIQRYTYRVLQTIQMKLIVLWVWAEQAVLGRAKTALKFKYEI